MWKWHENNPWGAVTLKKSLLFLLPRVWADLLLSFTVSEFEAAAMNAVRQAVHSYDMLWPPYCFCVEKLHIIKVNVSVLDKPLYQKMVLWSWSLSRVSSSESLKGSCNVLPLWTTASTQENSDFPCIFQIPSFPLSFIEEKDPGRSLQQGHIRLIKPLKE